MKSQDGSEILVNKDQPKQDLQKDDLDEYVAKMKVVDQEEEKKDMQKDSGKPAPLFLIRKPFAFQQNDKQDKPASLTEEEEKLKYKMMLERIQEIENQQKNIKHDDMGLEIIDLDDFEDDKDFQKDILQKDVDGKGQDKDDNKEKSE